MVDSVKKSSGPQQFRRRRLRSGGCLPHTPNEVAFSAVTPGTAYLPFERLCDQDNVLTIQGCQVEYGSVQSSHDLSYDSNAQMCVCVVLVSRSKVGRMSPAGCDFDIVECSSTREGGELEQRIRVLRWEQRNVFNPKKDENYQSATYLHGIFWPERVFRSE